MTPTYFRESNAYFGPPPQLDDSQCGSMHAYRGTVEVGSVEGTPLTVVAWVPTAAELADLQAGAPIFVTMLSEGLIPHMLTTSFHRATHPA